MSVEENIVVVLYVNKREGVAGHRVAGGATVLAVYHLAELLEREPAAAHFDERADYGAHHVAQETVGRDFELPHVVGRFFPHGAAHAADVGLRVGVELGETGEVINRQQVTGGAVHRLEIERIGDARGVVARKGIFAGVHPIMIRTGFCAETGVGVVAHGADARHGDVVRKNAVELFGEPLPVNRLWHVEVAEGVGKAFDGKQIFSNATFTIERGDKVAFVGRNGEGKSTLVKCIMGQLQHEGKLTLGHNVQIGYFAQNQASLLDGELTVFQTIDDVAKGDIRNKIRDLLGAFMFGGEASTKKVKVLSGGERTRLALLKLLLEPVNLLILDEPTNHLDLRTKDVLKQALADFDGTLICVSHDRDFLDGLVSRVYEFGGGKVTEHLCGIYEFLEKKKMDELQELERKR